MQTDFTLVIPTYNRPEQLFKLLSYLARERVMFSILVLDSSHLENKKNNQTMIQKIPLNITYLEYDQSIKPFDKFYDGVRHVETAFCQLCADDDFILVKNISVCIEQFKQQPEASVVHGYYFMFSESGSKCSMDIPQILYYSNTIGASEPLHRLRALFCQYQALTYGMYRTLILERILKTIRKVDQILARELLGSALAVVYGKAIRLPLFTHGRSLGASESYQYWHPLEWLMKTPQGLFSGYKQYQNILVEELMSTLNNGVYTKEEVIRQVDLIHMYYLLRHAPEGSYQFILDKIMLGNSVDDIWQASEVQMPLIQAAFSLPLLMANQRRLRLRDHKIVKYILHKISETFIKKPSLIQTVQTAVRAYHFHPNFLFPKIEGLFVKNEDTTGLTMALDNYY